MDLEDSKLILYAGISLHASLTSAGLYRQYIEYKKELPVSVILKPIASRCTLFFTEQGNNKEIYIKNNGKLPSLKGEIQPDWIDLLSFLKSKFIKSCQTQLLNDQSLFQDIAYFKKLLAILMFAVWGCFCNIEPEY